MARWSRRSFTWPSGFLVLAIFLTFTGSIAEGGAEDGSPERAPGFTHEALDAKPNERAPAGEPARAEVTGQFVHGFDDRTQVLNTTLYPFRTVVFLELYGYFGEYLGHCSGTMVGPDVVLTAAHCLYDPFFGWTENVAVVPGKNGASEPFGFEWAEMWWVPDAWVTTGGSSLFDWGLIALPDSTLGDVTGWMPVGVALTSTLQQPDFQPAIVGYPGDKPAGTMWGDGAQAFASVSDFFVEYDIDTMGGQSGSAVYSYNLDKPYFAFVVAIHIEGGAVYNRGARVDEELAQDLLLGCFLMACSVEVLEEKEPAEAGPTEPAPDLDFKGVVGGVARQ